MRRRYLFVSVFVVLLAQADIAWAWGYTVHSRINHQAALLIPAPLGAYTTRHANDLSLYGPSADFIKDAYPEESHRHYIDLDLYPTDVLKKTPRDFQSFVKTYGDSAVNARGVIPWAIEETMERITRLLKRGQWESALFYMGILGHYVADIHMPLHTTANYNGQLTNNKGVHFRWETRMVDEFIPVFKPVGEVVYLSKPLENTFEIISRSHDLYPALLHADSLARRDLTPVQKEQLSTYEILSFEEPYLTRLYKETETIVEDRLGRAVVMVASYWWTCWVNAGRPSIPAP
jgi:hypothetical protein